MTIAMRPAALTLPDCSSLVCTGLGRLTYRGCWPHATLSVDALRRFVGRQIAVGSPFCREPVLVTIDGVSHDRTTDAYHVSVVDGEGHASHLRVMVGPEVSVRYTSDGPVAS